MVAGALKLKHLSRPEKIFLGDTNLMDALVPQPNAGAVRETFFVNQLRAAGHSLLVPAKGDFIVDESSLFEVGGEGKGFMENDMPFLRNIAKLDDVAKRLNGFQAKSWPRMDTLVVFGMPVLDLEKKSGPSEA